MGKKNNRDHKPEVEYLREQNKILKAENRHLKKLLGQSDKKVRAYEEHVDLSIEVDMPYEEPQSQVNKCQEKGCDGTTERVDLGVRMMHVCRSCGARKTYKK